MIGLGTNRLSASRLAGLREARQFRNGQWIEGAGSWGSPYSAAATRALKAAFQTQWATIRDYGWEHPEIVGYMNAYAVEDAKIAMSLVPGIGDRYLVGDGVAWIATGLTTEANMTLETKIMPHSDDISNRRYLIGGNVAWGAFLLRFYNNGFMWHYGISGGDHQVGTPVVDTGYKIEASLRTIAVDGNSWTSTNTRSPLTGNTLNIFKSGNMNDLVSKSGFARTKIGNDGTPMLDYCPFIRKINNVDVCGFIDLVTGNFKQNAASSGSFTISEEPAA